MTQPKEIDVEVVPADIAQKLDQHEKNIRTFLAGEKKGAAEMFGYYFLAGKEMLAAKEIVPHGNADATAGIKRWLESRFSKMPYRTCASRMEFARDIMSQAGTLPPLKKRPLFLSNGDMKEKDRNLVLKVIPLVMDGKSMTRFMRDCKLIPEATKQKHHKRKNVSAQEANKAKCKQAKRVWDRLTGDLETACKVINRIEQVSDLKRYADCLVDAGNKIRAAIKKRGEQESK